MDDSPVDLAKKAATEKGKPEAEEIIAVLSKIADAESGMMYRTVEAYGVEKVDIDGWARRIFVLEYLRSSVEAKVKRSDKRG